MNPLQAQRYVSPFTCFGLPLVALAFGPDPARGEPSGHAVGVLAVGDRATGLVAIGGVARGLVTVGGISVGVFAVGGLSVGAVAVGGMAVGGLAVGGAAIGWWALGGTAFGVLKAVGGLAFTLRRQLGL